MHHPFLIQGVLRFPIVLLVASALFGCASGYPDVNTDPAKNNKVTFQRDLFECIQAYPETGGGVHIRQRINCMKLKGWQ